ncbi:hypothetical protein PV10_01758 [Exophiala mesophila]|uniref:Clr5 domain-containing protein n=1 Tax=Exophiala mesophila TaxID=212818 RepID=A0A0D2AGM4_EXOME|nr:uncharacterized protein PV10_01758 [Exophiala mesophila]KIV98068.1 hypothetical protein PV10_01758 [Exophiala mesophila]
MTESPQGAQSRNIGPTPDQWAEVKDIFTHLYISENRKLKDVRHILSSRHGFNASEKMFKRRIADWKVRKNYKAKDKENIARRVKAFVDAGQDVHSLSFQGRPVKLDRVRRHCRTDKRFSELLEHLSHSPEDVTISDPNVKQDSPPNALASARLWQASTCTPEAPDVQMEETQSHGTRMSRTISLPTDFHAVEKTIFHTREAVSWHFIAFRPLKIRELERRFPQTISPEVRARRIDQASEFWLKLYHGYEHMEQGRSLEAWTAFDRCCQMIQPLIMSAPLHLVSCLLLHFATTWQGLNDLQHSLLDFVSSMARQVLGQDHPLAIALSMVATADIRDHVVEPMMGLIIEGYEARRKFDNPSLFALQVDRIDMLRKRKNFVKARTLCQKLVVDSQTMRKQKRHRTALAALGRIYSDQGKELAVEAIAHRILDNERADPLGSNSGGTSSWACDQLATLYMHRGENTAAESYLRRAVYLTHHRYPNRGPSAMAFLQRLGFCLQIQGKQQSVEQICEDMGLRIQDFKT